MNRYQKLAEIALYSCLVLFSIYMLYNFMPYSANFLDPFSGDLAEDYTPSNAIPASVWLERAKSVKLAFLHGYHGYERYAQPHDELLPLSNGYRDNFNGWGVTMYDSLDTCIIMGLENEYNRSREYIEKTVFTLPEGEFAPLFETVIRYLGGLLSAYALNRDKLLLRRADELADKLDHAFATPSGMPLFGVNPNGGVVGPELGILAEIASLQLEYSTLAKFTGKKRWWDRADTVIQTLSKANLHRTGGMFPIRWNLTTGQPFDTHLSVGAQADSTHEYLLKQYLLTAKTDKASLEMYIRATTHIITNLLFLSPHRHLLYVTDTTFSTVEHRARPTHRFEHLSCFLPGLLALGASTLPLDDLESLGISLEGLGNESMFGKAGRNYQHLSGYNLKKLHLWAAKGLAQTCWLSYADMPTGLGADEMVMHTAGDDRWGETLDGFKEGAGYLWIEAMDRWKRSGARGAPPGVGDKTPTLESLYLLWKITGNVKWRDRGWKIFESIERHTKTPTGYASLKTVEVIPAVKDDDMPSYFFAETLKYLYLMFIDEDPVPLDQWVFNTEAHALPIFRWNEIEKDTFHIH
ncbi:hypothetical protein D9757_008115 [Collybiopsis confluens]|uniref:alpha-1,2-Mannosidase n=1 Tax=Collybiopsis confluens TaxID=2823264 RepID=A0A8H5M1V4_9AGAR|nr:hypothetical protein D9757_008115 [Collybiopsis confluens]